MSNRGNPEAECICLQTQVKTVVVVKMVLLVSIIILTIMHFINRERENTSSPSITS